jgi:uncharacterized caspase-like protein
MLPGAATASRVKSALVIGINNYKQSPLRCCVKDANAVEAKLQSIGFKVTKVLDRDSAHPQRSWSHHCLTEELYLAGRE